MALAWLGLHALDWVGLRDSPCIILAYTSLLRLLRHVIACNLTIWTPRGPLSLSRSCHASSALCPHCQVPACRCNGMFCSQGCQVLPTFPLPTLACTVSHSYLLSLPIFVPASVNWSFFWNLCQALAAECIPCPCGGVYVDRVTETSKRQLSELEPSPSSSSSQDQPQCLLSESVCHS